MWSRNSEGCDAIYVKYSAPTVKKKLSFLERYLQRFVQKNYESGFSKCYYIDAFAGTGKNYIEETDEVVDGSVLIALYTNPAFTDYWFVELDDMNMVSLQNNVAKYGRQLNANIRTIYGDCNWCLPNEVLPEISSTPTFVFFDPFAVEELYWKTVEKTGDLENVTTLINFSIMGITRLSQKKGARKNVDRYYGTRKWRKIARDRTLGKLHAYQARKQFLNLYESQLQSKFEYVQTLFPVIHEGKYLYYLILASHDEEAIEIDKDVGR